MTERAIAAADQGVGFREKPRPLISDFVFEKSFFSGSSIDYQTPCTSSEGRPCDIFGALPIWNEFFWKVGLELRELSPGQLSLHKMDNEWLNPKKRPRDEAAMLLHRLLTCHRCLVSVVLNWAIIMDHSQLICDALPRSPSLRKLQLYLRYTDNPELPSFAAALPLLTSLQELDCGLRNLQRTFCEGLSELLLSTASLTTLKLEARKVEPEHADVIFHALKRNKTVTTLSLSMCMSGFLSRGGVVFADYLRENQTLRTLILKWFHGNEVDFIIRSLFRATAISEVRLICVTLNRESMRLVAELLTENKSLKDFHVKQCNLHDMPECDGVSGRFRLWIAALGVNSTLERLTMDIVWFNLEECRSFIKAFASHKSLKSITVELINPADAVEVCRALREYDMAERFFLSGPHTVKHPAVAMMECKELSSIRINSDVLCEFDWLHTALGLLPSCNHVTSLTIVVGEEGFDGVAISLMRQYIEDTIVLRDMEVRLCTGKSFTGNRVEGPLVLALYYNKSIRKLAMKGFSFSEREIGWLVYKLEASRMLCELTFYPFDSMSSIWLMRKLSPIVSSNYTLLSMKKCGGRHEDQFAVDNVVRRNLALVTRAAHFVTGTRHRYCAAAAELVHWNPGLVAKVQELASVDENEAVSRIEKSLKSYTEFDDFMCVAGVVKCGVTCHKRDDGQLQVTDLNRDCWLHIRQYLKMGDILDAR